MQNLCNMINGMAHLAEHPGPEVMAKCLQKLEEVLESGQRQEEGIKLLQTPSGHSQLWMNCSQTLSTG